MWTQLTLVAAVLKWAGVIDLPWPAVVAPFVFFHGLGALVVVAILVLRQVRGADTGSQPGRSNR